MTLPSGFQPFGPVAAGFLAAIASCLFGTDARPAEPAWSPIALMPRAADYTHMWWAEGFPAHTPSAPWRRCIQTGYYAMVLDTPTLSIPHLGPVPAGLDYLACARADNQIWQALPPAELMLTITANGKCYRGTAGGPWSDFRGPRLIESGRFVQRADVTDLVFTAEDGQRLNVDARLETMAWPDRLALILAARPAHAPIPAGDVCFGRLGGGFGLDGTNHLEIPHAPELDCEQFTLEFWVFLPANYQVSQRTPPWLVCKNQNEEAEGNYGIVLLGGTPRAVINIGGGRDNQFFVDAQRGRALQIDTWNHVAISYDGNTLRLFVNGDTAGEKWIGRPRVSGHEGLAFGRRQDNSGDGYYFRGAVDEIRLYDQALPPAELRQRVLHPELELASVAAVREEWRRDQAAYRRADHGHVRHPARHGRQPDRHPRAAQQELAWSARGRRVCRDVVPRLLAGASAAAGRGRTGADDRLRSLGRSRCCLARAALLDRLGQQPTLGPERPGLVGREHLLRTRPGSGPVRYPRRAARHGARNERRPALALDPQCRRRRLLPVVRCGGQRVPHARMRTAYQRYGPCLTEVTYAGRIGDGLEHSATVSLARTDDLVRGVYRLRLDVTRATDFSRFVIFQIGADTYSYTGERKMALGNEAACCGSGLRSGAAKRTARARGMPRTRAVGFPARGRLRAASRAGMAPGRTAVS
jgi:hypothetical protein